MTEQVKMARQWSGASKAGICSLLGIEETVPMTCTVAKVLGKREEWHEGLKMLVPSK